MKIIQVQTYTERVVCLNRFHLEFARRWIFDWYRCNGNIYSRKLLKLVIYTNHILYDYVVRLIEIVNSAVVCLSQIL